MPDLRYERALARQGCRWVAGVDEAGRGPLAGPIVAAAVILPPAVSLPGLADSKQLSARQRERLYSLIAQQALAVGVGVVGHRLIDRLGIGPANKLVMQVAQLRLVIKPDYLLIDGRIRIPGVVVPQRAIVGGDRKCASIAAASIIAKVTRDRIMVGYHRQYPQYGFDRHKGYGTAAHRQKLRTLGPCAIHRRSFRPVSAFPCPA